jgi:hypothetical protein
VPGEELRGSHRLVQQPPRLPRPHVRPRHRARGRDRWATSPSTSPMLCRTPAELGRPTSPLRPRGPPQEPREGGPARRPPRAGSGRVHELGARGDRRARRRGRDRAPRRGRPRRSKAELAAPGPPH